MHSRFLFPFLSMTVIALFMAALAKYQPWKKLNEEVNTGEKIENNSFKTNNNPDLTVDETGLSRATVSIHTQKGNIKFKFYAEDAPKTVSRIIQLINSGFYNGLNFHRVVPGFVVQGGDPNGNGTGGSGTKLKAEFNGRHHLEGTLAMARTADPNSADSQFHICLDRQPHLDGQYTVFGQVIEGMETVKKVKTGDKMTTVSID